MIADGEDELICDFAETYHILDWRALPLRTAARLAAGLPPDCRVRRKLCELRVPFDTLLLAQIRDYLAVFHWWRTEDGRHGRNPPKLFSEVLVGEQEKQTNIRVFRTKQDFLAAYNRMLGG